MMPDSVYSCLWPSIPNVKICLLELAITFGFAVKDSAKAKVVCVSKVYELNKCVMSICAAVGHSVVHNVRLADETASHIRMVGAMCSCYTSRPCKRAQDGEVNKRSDLLCK